MEGIHIFNQIHSTSDTLSGFSLNWKTFNIQLIAKEIIFLFNKTDLQTTNEMQHLQMASLQFFKFA